MPGLKLVQRSITNRPTVTTLQLATEGSLPINEDTGGLGEPRTDPLKMLREEECRETVQ